MSLFLLYRTNANERNSNGLHSALVEAANAPAARALAAASAPDGETVVHEGWVAVELAASSSMPKPIIWFSGDAVSLLGMTRGGDPVA